MLKMKTFLLVLVLGFIDFIYGGVVPASTTLIKSSSSIAHPLFYSQQQAPLAVSYSAPLAYSHAVAPIVYPQRLLAPAHYISPSLTHGPVYAHQQSIFAQYPGLFAQSPILGHYPVQAPVIGQYPGVVQGPSQIPIQGGSPVIEPADNPQFVPQPSPIQAPQQSPIVSGGSPGTIVDDDTVSIESA